NVHEVARRHEASLWVTPAQQRLSSDKLARLEGHERLIMNLELTKLDTLAHVDVEIAPMLQILEHLCREEAVGRPSFRLNIIERQIGILHQRIGVLVRFERQR